jgi:hypothetical protein
MFDAEAAYQMISGAVAEIDDLRTQLIEQDNWMRDQMGVALAFQERVDYLEEVLRQAKRVAGARAGIPAERLMMLAIAEEVKQRHGNATPLNEDEQRHLILLLNYVDDLVRAIGGPDVKDGR